MKTLFFLLISILLFASACKSKKNASDSNAKALNNPETVVEEAQSTAEETKPTIPTESLEAVSISEAVPNVEVVEQLPKETANFNVKSAKCEGDFLILELSYGGGCVEHQFYLYTDMNYAKSLPPQMNLFLSHEANGDNCKALQSKVIKFDISKIRNDKSSSLLINLNQFKGQITYKY